MEERHSFSLKGTGSLTHHLGADFEQDEDGTLTMSPRKHVDQMMFNFQRMFGGLPPTTVQSPVEHGDHPELDKSELLDQEGIEECQSLIGSQQWQSLLAGLTQNVL